MATNVAPSNRQLNIVPLGLLVQAIHAPPTDISFKNTTPKEFTKFIRSLKSGNDGFSSKTLKILCNLAGLSFNYL